jgi:hypothetical protein
MKALNKHFGRLGNRLFQAAFLYAYAKDHKIDYYFQDPKWFEKYASEIKQMFGEGIGWENKVAVHFRRGKNPSNPNEPAYSDNPFYVDLSKTDYYKKAMALFPNEKFLLFSDDNKWLEQNWQNGYEYATGNEEEDLLRFAGCKGHIIANSSWSWWGAYLGRGDVVYPKAWFADGVQRVGFPKEWICV